MQTSVWADANISVGRWKCNDSLLPFWKVVPGFRNVSGWVDVFKALARTVRIPTLQDTRNVNPGLINPWLINRGDSSLLEGTPPNGTGLILLGQH